MKALITTIPFGEMDKTPIDLLNEHNIEYTINPFNKKITEKELYSIIGEYDILIAGTEIISRKVLDNAKKLKLISRVGVGLDGVDLHYARAKGIKVTYTPDAPALAVAELSIGLMINLLRNVHISNQLMHNGKWKRLLGRRLSQISCGIIGAGRIGSLVIKKLNSLGNKAVLVNDIKQNKVLDKLNIKWVTKEEIYRTCDLISIHTPLTDKTHNMISTNEMKLMKSNIVLINTARGGIINELNLAEMLNSGKLGGAAIDVFEHEPYSGPLGKIDKCLLTSHMGSMSLDCRARMEYEAVLEAVSFVNNQKLNNEVPEFEYFMKMEA
jgi:D-3-phosphoglycerate dehydrogenase / 2-oxoglutarate reductase